MQTAIPRPLAVGFYLADHLLTKPVLRALLAHRSHSLISNGFHRIAQPLKKLMVSRQSIGWLFSKARQLELRNQLCAGLALLILVGSDSRHEGFHRRQIESIFATVDPFSQCGEAIAIDPHPTIERRK